MGGKHKWHNARYYYGRPALAILSRNSGWRAPFPFDLYERRCRSCETVDHSSIVGIRKQYK